MDCQEVSGVLQEEENIAPVNACSEGQPVKGTCVPSECEEQNESVEQETEGSKEEGENFSSEKESVSDKGSEAEMDFMTEDEGSTLAEENEQSLQEGQESVEGMLGEMKNILDALSRKFDEKIAIDAHKAELFNRMYDELAAYKKDLYSKIMKPFIMETISLLDDYERIIERMDTFDEEKLKKYIQGVPDDLQNLLSNNGVERFEDDSEKFNPKTQRAVRTEQTEDSALDNTIAERIRQGYYWNGIILKPEMVKIYKFKG